MKNLMSTAEAASYLALQPGTLKGWRRMRKGPPYLVVGGKVVRYRVEDLQAWAGQQVAGPGRDGAAHDRR